MAQFETSAHFDEKEKLVLQLAVSMTRTPSNISDKLYESLRAHFSERELVELSAVIAWENARARLNRVFAVQSENYSEGKFCPLPER
ncbi:MAG TPA: hypothetical protein VMF66_15140 [Candidatus Acidoferrum sp.]|nr:hypothetical protein [Candidatus Acidoferrum sp.]